MKKPALAGFFFGAMSDFYEIAKHPPISKLAQQTSSAQEHFATLVPPRLPGRVGVGYEVRWKFNDCAICHRLTPS
jgi:hypothetical protein